MITSPLLGREPHEKGGEGGERVANEIGRLRVRSETISADYSWVGAVGDSVSGLQSPNPSPGLARVDTFLDHLSYYKTEEDKEE